MPQPENREQPHHPGATIEVPLEDGAYRGPRPPVSIVILTYNEEGNIADCIRSCAWSDDVHVLDSGSTDKTRQIAESLGCKVHVNPFKSFGEQRNWAIDNIPCKHPWHFHLDADERFTVGIVKEMLDTVGQHGTGTDNACFLVPSKMILMGRWLKWSGGYPSYQVRLFRFGQCRFLDFGHGQREDPRGPTGTLAQPYHHYSFSKGLCEWLYKHNNYSCREAAEGLAALTHARPTIGSLFKGDKVNRRRTFKNFAYFLRFRALWRFFYNFIVRGGILDGVPGFHYCAMIAMYEYWIELKMKEKRQRWTEETNALVVRMSRDNTTANTPGTAPLSAGGAA
jgi:glycosyltransferase involved in cell wall biosynthesis